MCPTQTENVHDSPQYFVINTDSFLQATAAQKENIALEYKQLL